MGEFDLRKSPHFHSHRGFSPVDKAHLDQRNRLNGFSGRTIICGEKKTVKTVPETFVCHDITGLKPRCE
jgi:hypothetical protein